MDSSIGTGIYLSFSWNYFLRFLFYFYSYAFYSFLPKRILNGFCFPSADFGDLEWASFLYSTFVRYAFSWAFIASWSSLNAILWFCFNMFSSNLISSSNCLNFCSISMNLGLLNEWITTVVGFSIVLRYFFLV